VTKACGASREEALATGLFVLAGGEVREIFRSRLVLPYWRSNRVVYFIARRTEYTPDDPREQAKYKKLLTHSDKHRYVSPEVGNDYFVGEDAAREGGELLICEGITARSAPCRRARRALAGHGALPQAGPRQARGADVEGEPGRHLQRRRGERRRRGRRSGDARVLHQAGRNVRIGSIPRPAGVAKID
jgi:hypothetical protein